MKQEKKKLKNIILLILGIFLILTCSALIFFKFYINPHLKKYNNKTYPNTYIDGYDVSDISYKEVKKALTILSDEVLSRKVELIYNDIKIKTTYKELGLNIEIEKTLNHIKNSSNKLTYNKKLLKYLFNTKSNYNYVTSINNAVLSNYLTTIKNEYDFNGTTEKFEIDDNRNVKYIKGEDSHYLNFDKNYELISKKIKKDVSKNKKISLIVDCVKQENHELYALIDTKVSSFSTSFNPYISRATNLKTALSYIDGAIINPNEVFSFYNYAGPYNKNGYVFYYEFVGNGVCQIATTLYNAALLGGLEIIERYQHANLVPYVQGGLDATVASYSDGRYIDFKFKNTYKYPIYISAYSYNGVAYIDLWSNSNAKEGKTYSTESVNIGYLGYASYLHVYQNEVEIEKRFLARSWYKEDK